MFLLKKKTVWFWIITKNWFIRVMHLGNRLQWWISISSFRSDTFLFWISQFPNPVLTTQTIYACFPNLASTEHKWSSTITTAGSQWAFRQRFCCITELWLCAENEITSGLSHKFSAEMLLAAGHQNEYVPLTYRRQKTGVDAGLILTVPSTLFLKSRSSFYRVSPHPFSVQIIQFPSPPCFSKEKEI